MYIPNLSSMSVVEYVEFLITRAMHVRVSPFDLNMEYCFECGLISDEMYERAKWELVQRKQYMEVECEF